MNMAAPQFWQEINPFHSWKGYAALMCHAICVDWLMVALSSTPCCQHEQPLPKLLSMRASVPTIPWMGVRVLCQIRWCHFGFFPLIDVLLKPTPAASEWDSRLRVGCYTTGHAQTDRQTDRDSSIKILWRARTNAPCLVPFLRLLWIFLHSETHHYAIIV